MEIQTRRFYTLQEMIEAPQNLQTFCQLLITAIRDVGSQGLREKISVTAATGFDEALVFQSRQSISASKSFEALSLARFDMAFYSGELLEQI
ncbi:hypothetical protein CVT26_011108 [Gymnopilus dilepis]|uniref:Uncharacterized protein n=1 Tax=Gymnopilus dilepis TaxID=231916 RepID=A0A409WRQ2_9AGAR|nr:hypothetical protein CVT26_011108 [Gymnopilus dilepis]